MRKFPALGSALVLALTGALITAPAVARTHHPSTAKEREATRDLNLQQLAAAQGQAPANQQAMNAGQTAPAQGQTQSQSAPSDQTNGQAAQSSSAPAPNAPATTTNGTQAPATSSDSTTPKAQQPAPSGSQ
jgi:hypothetical protein